MCRVLQGLLRPARIIHGKISKNVGNASTRRAAILEGSDTLAQKEQLRDATLHRSAASKPSKQMKQSVTVGLYKGEQVENSNDFVTRAG